LRLEALIRRRFRDLQTPAGHIFCSSAHEPVTLAGSRLPLL
jgi:hypothetical protein